MQRIQRMSFSATFYIFLPSSALGFRADLSAYLGKRSFCVESGFGEFMR